MRRFLFRSRRSSIRQWFVMICLSACTAVLIAAAVIARIMLHFGMQYEPMTGENNFSSWLMERSAVDFGQAHSFFMYLRPVLMEITGSLKVYVWIMAAVITVLVLMFCYLMASAGYHGKVKEPCLRGAERIPFDISLPVLVVGLMILHSIKMDYVYTMVKRNVKLKKEDKVNLFI